MIVCKNCYATGDVTSTASGSSVGGFVGQVGGWFGGNSGWIRQCFATGDVYGYDSNVGGFAGSAMGFVFDCYARGDVEVEVPLCFVVGTLITMGDGSFKAIENVNVGDEVLLGGLVDRVFTHKAEMYLKINDLCVTVEHPLLSSGKWFRAGMLCVGDSLTDKDGKSIMITSISVVREEVEVRNLTVAKHVYVASGVIAHNK